MRILFISNPDSSNTKVWINWFASRGHQVCLIADTYSQIKWPGMEIYDLPKKFNIRIIRYFIWEVWIRKILKEWQPDILHAHRVSSAGWLGSFSGFHPFVVTPWGSDLFLHPELSYIARKLASIVLNNADLITLNSKTLCQKAIQLGADPNHCQLISWGVDLNLFHPSNKTTLREELGCGNAPIILSPRAVKPLYNLDVIIESIPIVLSIYPEALYLLQSYNIDEIYKNKLEKRINELGIKSSLRWVPFQSPDRYADYFRISNVVISIPSSDSMPITVLEALACGSPVIVSDLPSMREIIIDQVNGKIVPIRNIQALASATIDLLNNPQLQTSFSQYNTHWVQKNANRDIELKKMESLYLDLIT
jgi:L-malate glycosyltransferase